MNSLNNENRNINSQALEFLNSMVRISLTLELAKKYQISQEDSPMITELIFDLATGDVLFIDLLKEVEEGFSFDDQTALAFSRDLLGNNFLFIENYFPGMMEAFSSFGGKPENYSEVISRISKELAEERKYFTEQLSPSEEYIFQTKDSADQPFFLEEYQEIFKSGVFSFLLGITNQKIIEEFNQEAIVFIDENPLAKNEFLKNLLNNQESLGSNQIVIENKKVDPTAANWLKDFIREKGSDQFDDLALAEYLASASNPKNLSPAEKNQLRRLFNLYRNLAFFPESQIDLPPEKWEIIPIEEDLETKFPSEGKEINSADNSARRELEESLRNFQKGSLEYRAAGEELERLNKKS